MRVFSEIVGEGTATLTGYVLDGSTEMGNAAIRPAVLVLPGGGYFMTSDREAEPVALAYLAEGSTRSSCGTASARRRRSSTR